MEMHITFPGNLKVDAEYAGFTVHTDQPVGGGGDGSAPSPFALFLSSIGTCAGIYVLGFCRQRGIPTDGIRLTQRMDHDASVMISRIGIDIEVPRDFPERYRDALVKVAGLCAVKKHLQQPPAFDIRTVVV